MLAAQCLTVVASVLLAAGVHGVAGIYGCLFLMAVDTNVPVADPPGACLPDTGPPGGALERDHLECHHVRNRQRGRTGAGRNHSCAGEQPHGLFVQAVCAVTVLLCLAGVNFGRKHAVQTGSALEGLRFIRDNKLILTAVSLDLFAVPLWRSHRAAADLMRWIFCTQARARWAGCAPPPLWELS